MIETTAIIKAQNWCINSPLKKCTIAQLLQKYTKKLLCISLLLLCNSAMAVDNVLMNAYAVCLNHSNMAPNKPESEYRYDKGFEDCHRIVTSVNKKIQQDNAVWVEQERQKDLKAVDNAAGELQ